VDANTATAANTGDIPEDNACYVRTTPEYCLRASVRGSPWGRYARLAVRELTLTFGKADGSVDRI
jgi:hypothetical protein